MANAASEQMNSTREVRVDEPAHVMGGRQFSPGLPFVWLSPTLRRSLLLHDP